MSVNCNYQPFILERDALRGRDHFSSPSARQAASASQGHCNYRASLVLVLFVCLFDRFLLCTLAELCNTGWPQTLSNPPVSASCASSTGVPPSSAEMLGLSNK